MGPDYLDWKTRRQLDKEVQRLFRDLRRELQLLDVPPSLDAIALVVSGVRGKPLFRRRRKLPGGVTGLSGALTDSDVIICCSLAEEPLARFSEAHELTHFWGGHFPKVSLPFDIELVDALTDKELELLCLSQGVLCHGPHSERGSTSFTDPREYVSERHAGRVIDYLGKFNGHNSLLDRWIFGS